MCLDFYTIFSETFLIPQRIERDIIINVLRSSCKVPVILVRFQRNLNSLDSFAKDTQITSFFNALNAELNPSCHLLALILAHHILHVSRIKVKIFPKGAELLQSDGQTDMTKVTVALCKFSKVLKIN